MAPSAVDAPPLTLVVEKGPRKGEKIECRPGGRVRIGRVVRGNTFTIKEAGISQAHLSIKADAAGAGWAVTDLGSSNGTLLNGVRIEPSAPTPLHDGDAIKIGEETAIQVRIAEMEAPAAPVVAGRRRNPRRGCAAVAAEAAQEEAGGRARGRGRPRRTDADGDDDARNEERADPAINEGVEGPGKKIATRRGRGRGGRKKAAPAPACLDSVSQEPEREDLVVGRGGPKNAAPAPAYSDSASQEPEREDLVVAENKVLKEMKQETPDSIKNLSVKGTVASAKRGPEGPRTATANTGTTEEEHVRVEDESDAPLREEDHVAGANPGVEGGSVDMENMTLEEWFDRMEKYLPKVINEIAEEVISDIKAKAERFNEYVGNNLDYEGRDVGSGFV